MSHKNEEERRKKRSTKIALEKEQYNLRDIIDQLRTANFCLIVIAMILAGIFVKLIFGGW
jgi:hypothetical protein